MKAHRFTLLMVAAASLAGCSSGPTSKIIADSTPMIIASTAALTTLPRKSLASGPATRGSSTYLDSVADAAKPTARYAKRAWHGARMIDVQDDEMLPAVFQEVRKFDFDDRASGGRVELAVVAERLSRVTGVQVRVKADVYTSTAGGGASARPAQSALVQPMPQFSPLPVPSGPMGSPSAPMPLSAANGANNQALMAAMQSTYTQPITGLSSIEMKWNGTPSSFLDYTTSRLGLSWSYRDGVVVIERYITETFEMSTFGGSQDYKMGLSGGNSGSGGGGGSTGAASSTLSLEEAGKIEVLKSLREAVENMVKPAGGSVVLNEGTGRFFVTAPKDVMSRVREVIRLEDSSLQRQAVIQFDIYSVISNDNKEAGVDWSIVFKSLTDAYGATIRTPAALTSSVAGSLGINILSKVPDSGSSARYGGSAAILSLLNQVGNNALYRPVSMVALNRQWARKTNLNTDGYLSETTPASGSLAGGGAPGLKTASITTGDKFIVQPAIMDNGTINLKFGVSLTELLGLFDQTAGSGSSFQKVQTPNTSGTDDQGTIRLNPGESMVVTGLSRRRASGDSRTLGEGISAGFGGSRKDSYKREDFLIIVRAVQI